jgi:hypothetical protein
MLRHQPYYVAKDKAHVTSAETKSTGLIKSSLRIYPTTEQEQAAMDAIYRGLPPRKIHPEPAARGSYDDQGRLAGYYHGNEESSHPEEWVLVSPVLDSEADRDEAAYSINQASTDNLTSAQPSMPYLHVIHGALTLNRMPPKGTRLECRDAGRVLLIWQYVTDVGRAKGGVAAHRRRVKTIVTVQRVARQSSSCS